jgi:hypothetical protein
MIRKQGGAEEEVENELPPMMTADEQADKCVEIFLKKFLIGSESTFLDNIDLVLLMKAIPGPITMYNLGQVDLFNLNILQSSIIAY